jgi:YndJ-like protein
VPQVGGAVLMALGVCGVAALELRRAGRDAPLGPGRRLLLGASGLAVWAPMVLAVSWAAAQHAGLPALPIPAMVRVHGVPNAVGFCLCGLLATGPPQRRTLRRAHGHPEGGHPWTSTSTTTASPAGPI